MNKIEGLVKGRLLWPGCIGGKEKRMRLRGDVEDEAKVWKYFQEEVGFPFFSGSVRVMSFLS